MLAYSGPRRKRISYKSVRGGFPGRDHTLPERMQVKTSFKPTCKATRGIPQLAQLSNNKRNSPTITDMQRMW